MGFLWDPPSLQVHYFHKSLPPALYISSAFPYAEKRKKNDLSRNPPRHSINNLYTVFLIWKTWYPKTSTVPRLMLTPPYINKKCSIPLTARLHSAPQQCEAIALLSGKALKADNKSWIPPKRPMISPAASELWKPHLFIKVLFNWGTNNTSAANNYLWPSMI